MKDGYVIGFDFGLRHIGGCVGQFVRKTASPLTTLAAKDGSPNWQAVKTLLDEWKPVRLVVGLPLNMDGTESEMSERARSFGDQLERRYQIPVAMVDERLSTRAAREAAELDKGATSHELAAVLIVESWLAQTAD